MQALQKVVLGAKHFVSTYALSILYKGIAYKGFFGPVLKVLTDLRVLSTEASWAKGFLRSYSISLVTVTKRIVNKAM